MTYEERLKQMAIFDNQQYKTFGQSWHIKDLNYHLCYDTDYNELHRVWDKFRDFKFAKVSDQILHGCHKDVICNAIVFKPILTAFTALSDGVEWLGTIKEKV